MLPACVLLEIGIQNNACLILPHSLFLDTAYTVAIVQPTCRLSSQCVQSKIR